MEEMKDLQMAIDSHDRTIYSSFYALAKTNGCEKEYTELYRKFNLLDEEYDRFISPCITIMNGTYFVNQKTNFDKIEEGFENILEAENTMKNNIKSILDSGNYTDVLTPEIRQAFSFYTSTQLKYFDRPEYNNASLKILSDALGHYQFVLSKALINSKQRLLNFMRDLETKATAKHELKSI
jgi:hypothetical protein